MEDRGDGRTRLHFREMYHVLKPFFRALLERRVHRWISERNERLMRRGIDLFLSVAPRPG